MDMNYEDLQHMVEDSVDKVLKRNGYAHKCHLEEAGINAHTHKKHHLGLERMAKDWGRIRTAFIAGVLVTLFCGAGALLWTGITHTFLTGGG